MNRGVKKALAEKNRISKLEAKKNKTERDRAEIALYVKKLLVGTGTNSEESLRDFHILFPENQK